ncbi:hypothetical protein [Crenothrix sp.]|uniref:hypothetical protein n=1 Tax=Crenothrix sp. TaxID=3100433 RepID=UPI00374DD957
MVQVVTFVKSVGIHGMACVLQIPYSLNNFYVGWCTECRVDGDLYRNRVHVKGLLRADIYDCVDNMGHRFLLVSSYPLSGEVTVWRESVFEVIDTARDGWVRMKRREGKHGYDIHIMEEVLGDPRWSKRPLDEFVVEAFGDNIISAGDLRPDFSAHTSVKRTVRRSHTL